MLNMHIVITLSDIVLSVVASKLIMPTKDKQSSLFQRQIKKFYGIMLKMHGVIMLSDTVLGVTASQLKMLTMDKRSSLFQRQIKKFYGIDTWQR
jgi:hypothetical protein